MLQPCQPAVSSRVASACSAEPELGDQPALCCCSGLSWSSRHAPTSDQHKHCCSDRKQHKAVLSCALHDSQWCCRLWHPRSWLRFNAPPFLVSSLGNLLNERMRCVHTLGRHNAEQRAANKSNSFHEKVREAGPQG